MSEDAQPSGGKSRRLWVALPLIVFAALAVLFLLQLESGRDVRLIPSALIGQPAPETELPPLEGSGLPGLDTKAMKGQLTLVNVWASWCVPCRQEHPVLMELANDKRFKLVGFNYKDKPENARRFLGGLGNPFSALGVDESGRAAINWGVYGVPESYLVGPDGTILWKQTGPFTPDIVSGDLEAAVEKALKPQQ